MLAPSRTLRPELPVLGRLHGVLHTSDPNLGIRGGLAPFVALPVLLLHHHHHRIVLVDAPSRDAAAPGEMAPVVPAAVANKRHAWDFFQTGGKRHLGAASVPSGLSARHHLLLAVSIGACVGQRVETVECVVANSMIETPPGV